MITINLTRQSKQGKAVRGSILLPFSQRPTYVSENGDRDVTIKTLENSDFIIPAGTYPLRLTYSPKFKKMLPLIEEVPVTNGAPDTNQRSVCGGESGGRSCTDDLAERYRPLQSPCQTRQGIRIHRGTIPEHSTGCVLVDMYGQACLDAFINRLKNFYDNEEISICITDDYGA